MNRTSKIWARLAAVLGIAMIFAGASICLRAARAHGQDFSYLYVLGKVISQGQNPYDLPTAKATFLQHYGLVPNDGQARIYYPPSTGIVLMPLVVMPYKTALTLWTGILLLSLPLAVWYLLHVVAARIPLEYRVLAVGAVFCSSSLRWGVQLLQPAPLVAAMCAVFIADILTGKFRRAAVLAVLALCLKMTLALPFVGVLLLRRQFGTVCAVIGVWMLVMLAGFGVAGGSQAMDDYRQSMATMETETREVNSPDPYLPQSLPRLDYAYFTHFVLNARAQSPTAKWGALVLSGASLLVLAVLGIKAGKNASDEPVMLLFFMAFSCLTLLAVYHHHYDVALLLPSFVVLLDPRLKPLRRGLLLAGLPLLLYLAFYPQAQAQMALSRWFGETAFALAKVLGAFCIVLFFAGIVWMLVRLNRHPLPSGAEGDAFVY